MHPHQVLLRTGTMVLGKTGSLVLLWPEAPRPRLIGINSSQINSLESSSSSNATEVAGPTKKTTQGASKKVESATAFGPPDEVAETISRWAKERGVQRLRSDRRLGYPDGDHLGQWSRVLEQRGITETETIFAVLDAAVVAATRSGDWRNWAFLTLQVQLATERLQRASPMPAFSASFSYDLPDEDPTCDWAVAKQKIRRQVGEVPFGNWFEHSRQIGRRGGLITITVRDEASRLFLEAEYGSLTKTVLAELGIEEVEVTVATRESNTLQPELGGSK